MFRIFAGLMVSFLITDWMINEISSEFPKFAKSAGEIYHKFQIPTHHHWPSASELDELKLEISDYLNGERETLSHSWWKGGSGDVAAIAPVSAFSLFSVPLDDVPIADALHVSAKQLQELSWREGVRVVRLLGYGPLLDAQTTRLIVNRLRQYRDHEGRPYYRRELQIHAL